MNNKAFTVIELLVCMALVGIVSAIAIYNMRSFSDPTAEGTGHVMAFLKQSRAKALATTYAYTVKPATSGSLITTYGISCSSVTQTSDTQMTLALPNGVTFVSTAWSVCYTPRGLASANTNFSIQGNGDSYAVEVALGGGIRKL
jgi:prepilin-type N-terminal cleavage/methylation domain-containing protein